MKKTKRRRKPFLFIILMIVALSLLVGGCGGGAVQPPVAAINFADPILEAAVRNAAGYTGQPTGPIYPADVLGITVLNVDGPNTQASRDGQEDGNSGSRWERLEYQILVKNEERHRRFGEWGADSEPSTRGEGGLVSLEGIQHLTNLERLSFRNNQVSNLTPLQNLTNLEWLYFDNNQVSNLTPLQNLTNLEWLSYWNNQVSNLIPLQNLTNLQYLDFSDNQVSSLTPLQNLTNLRELYFSNNQVSSLAPLQNLTNLRELYFWSNQVSNLTPLQNLTNLQGLGFVNNQVSNLTPLQNLTNLQCLDFSNNHVSSLTPLQNLTNLRELYFGNNQVSNLTPLQNLTNLKRLLFDSNQVSNLTPLQNLTNLEWLSFADNQASDITPLVNNLGIGDGDYVNMKYNNLDLTAGSQDMANIDTLISRGCLVDYNPQNAGVALAIIEQPQSQTKSESDSVTFDVAASGGTPPYSYQWRKNGSNINGATGQSYTKNNLAASDAGQYSVVIKDSSSPQKSVTSENAELIVQAVVQTSHFKLANSWGIAEVDDENRWENVPDGFLYMTFEAAKAVNLEAWFYRPRSGYHPLAVAVIGMTHPVRNDTAVFLGVGNPSSPRIEKEVYGLRSFGGPFYSAGGPYPYPDNRIVVDITEFLPLNGESVYLRVFDSNGSTQTGTILYFSVETYVSYPNTLLSRYTSTQTPKPTSNGGSVSVSTPAISFSPIASRQTDRIREMLYQASDPLTMENISPSMVRKPGELNRTVDEMGTGLLHPTEEQWQDIVDRGLVRIVDSDRLVELVGRDQLRGGVDHSLSPHFPPIGNQGNKGSCVCFSTGYYIATFYLAREFGWDLSGATWSGAWPGAPSAAYRNRIMSPDFLFLQLYEYDAFTEAPDWGSYYVDNIVALSRIGISSWLQLPYLGSYPTNLSEYQGWPGEEAWRQAPLYRMDSPAPAQEVAWYLQVKNDTDIQALQALLDLGILISVSVDAFQYKNLSDEDLWDVNNYTKPEQGNHANTIVGYR
ncbi:MAG TPA: leucine-rich repeat domain-containing protein [Thermotogota bacterium]|nr:leucine-rich repeat domain-containing protein [Thermotogota bacterium]